MSYEQEDGSDTADRELFEGSRLMVELKEQFDSTASVGTALTAAHVKRGATNRQLA
jgi:hypothetical protein